MTNLRLAETPGHCSWDNCRMNASSRYMLTLCDDHITLILTLVNEADKDGKPEPAEVVPREYAVGFVYYLKIGDRLKVGYATNLARRIRQYPPGAELLAVKPGRPKDEKVEHSLLTVHRLEGREWYAINDETMAHVAAVIARHGSPPGIAGRRPAKRPDAVGSRSGAPWKVG